ncbi:MAG: protein jag [Clostridia bacterium]|nr:protein jag [Clostridia bacterium]
MEYKEYKGKTVEEAVELALQELGATKEEVEIHVLEEGKKKLFGSVPARVEVAKKDVETVEEEPISAEKMLETLSSVEKKDVYTDGERAVLFLEGLLRELKVDACTKLIKEDKKIEIEITANKTTFVIGKRGEVLDALQTLAGAVANTGREDYKRVVVDCENYREKREATLQKLAENLAQKAVRIQKKIKLEPMNPYERRIIHAALSDYEGITTQSEGKEPHRYIVVIPDGVDPESEPVETRTDRERSRQGGRGDRNGRNNRSNNKPNRDFNKYNREKSKSSSSSGGTSLKNLDFFGTFLGNSKNGDNE